MQVGSMQDKTATARAKSCVRSSWVVFSRPNRSCEGRALARGGWYPTQLLVSTIGHDRVKLTFNATCTHCVLSFDVHPERWTKKTRSHRP